MHISEEFDAILRYAGEEALRSGYPIVGPDHLMLGILRHSDNDACRILSGSGMDPDKLKLEIDSAIFLKKSLCDADTSSLEMTLGAQELVNKAMLEASLEGEEEVSAVHLLKAICSGPACISKARLKGLRFKRPGSRPAITRTFVIRRNDYFS